MMPAELNPREFLSFALTFAALLWGAFARGAFFEIDLIIFVILALGALATVPRIVLVVSRNPWLWWSGTCIVVAVLISAGVNHQMADVGFALGPVVAAVALGAVGLAAKRPAIVFRLLADIALLVAGLGWFGVAFHIGRFAELQDQGWRASATIGYANVTALFLLLGLLCAVAVDGDRPFDRIRPWFLVTAILATQSRGTAVALGVCWLILWLRRRPAGRLLGRSIGLGLVAFIGLIPSARGTANPGLALAGLIITVALTVAPARVRRFVGPTVGVLAAVAVGLALSARLADAGSVTGRFRLWDDAISSIPESGLFGRGPEQLAFLSEGRIATLFDHSDPIQYAQDYGVLGLLSLLVMGVLVALAVRRRDGTDVIAITAVAAVAIVSLVDFPLQIPLIPATLSLVIGSSINRKENHPCPIDRKADDRTESGIAISPSR